MLSAFFMLILVIFVLVIFVLAFLSVPFSLYDVARGGNLSVCVAVLFLSFAIENRFEVC